MNLSGRDIILEDFDMSNMSDTDWTDTFADIDQMNEHLYNFCVGLSMILSVESNRYDCGIDRFDAKDLVTHQYVTFNENTGLFYVHLDAAAPNSRSVFIDLPHASRA